MEGQGCTQSIHMRLLTLVARLVTMQACVACRSALSAELPLKPAWGRRSGSGSGSVRVGQGAGGGDVPKEDVNAHPHKKTH